MKKLITLIILTTSILVTAKEVEVIKFDNNQSPEIDKEILIKELKNQFGEFDSSCMTRNLGWSPKLSESFLSALRKSGATIPPRTGFDTSKYGIKYDIPYGCIGLLESKMHFVLEKHFKYYCEASKKGDLKESSKYINNIVNNTYEDFVFSCGIDSNKNSLAYLDAKDWYNQWTTGFNIWSEFMAKNANSKYTNIIAKRKADKEAKLAKQKTAKLKKTELTNTKTLEIKKEKISREDLWELRKKEIAEENIRLKEERGYKRKIAEEKYLAEQNLREEIAKKNEMKLKEKKRKEILGIRQGKNKLKSCDSSVFKSGDGLDILHHPLFEANNKSYAFTFMTLKTKYSAKKMLFTSATNKYLLVNTTQKTYIDANGINYLRTCIIGTVTDIKYIDGIALTVVDAAFIGDTYTE